MRNKILTIGLLLGASFISEAQSSLSLNEALIETLGDSPIIQKAKSSVEEAEWKRIGSYAGFLPTITANANVLGDKKFVFYNISFSGNPAVVPAIIPSSALYLNASLPIFDGFANVNTWRSSKSAEYAAENELEWTKFQTARTVTLQYYRALAAQTLKEVAEQNVKMLEDHLKDTRLFRKAGVVTKYDELQVEVKVSLAKSELLNAIDNVEITKRELAEMMGHETEERNIDGTLPVLDSNLLVKLQDDAVSSRQDIRALSYKAQSFSEKEAAASRYFVPKVALFGQYQFYNNLNTDWSNANYYRNAYQFGISATWNLFDGMSSISQSKQSVQQTYQAERTLKEAKLKASKDLDLWRRKFLYFANVYQSRLSDIRKSTESVRLAKEAIKVGSKTNTDLLDAESELFQAKAGAVNSQLGAIESFINLELAAGKKMYEFQ